MPEKTVLLIKGESRYDVLRKAADEIAQGFEDMGYQVDVLDLMEKEPSLPEDAIYANYSFLFSCQAIGFDWVDEENQPYLLQNIKSPYIGWVFDDALRHYNRAEHACFDHVALLTVDEMAIQTFERMIPGVKNIHYLPHGGFPSAESKLQKDIDILFPANFTVKPILETYNLSKEEQLLAEGVLAYLEHNPTISPRSALYYILDQMGVEITTDFLLFCSGVLTYTYDVIYYNCRRNILDTLLSSGLRTTVVGQGYEEMKEQYGNLLDIIPGADISEVVQLIQRSRIMINPVFPVLERGMHERIFTAMLQKTAIFTPYTSFQMEQLGNRLEYIDLRNPAAMIRKIQYVLDHYTEYDRTILDGNYNYAMKEHTWRIRGMQIAELFEAGRLVTSINR